MSDEAEHEQGEEKEKEFFHEGTIDGKARW